jgi:hypothetical protein
LDNDFAPLTNTDTIDGIRTALKSNRDQENATFGDYAGDGLGFIADKIKPFIKKNPISEVVYDK